MNVQWTSDECERLVNLLNMLSTQDTKPMKLNIEDRVLIQDVTTSLSTVSGNYRTGVAIYGRG